MQQENNYRILLGILYTLFVAVRIYFRRKYMGIRQSEAPFDRWVLRVYVGVLVSLVAGYIVFPQYILYASLNLPDAVRFLGLPAGLSGIALFIYAHTSLGASFNNTVLIKENQQLVRKGPYRLVRHPMYSAFYLLHLGFSLLSSNWVLAAGWLGGLTLFLLYRIPTEERMMENVYGQDYLVYRKTSGLFIPRLFSQSRKELEKNSPED